MVMISEVTLALATSLDEDAERMLNVVSVLVGGGNDNFV